MPCCTGSQANRKKTYIIERFAEDNYEELLEINFKQMVSAVDIFFR